MHAGYLRKTGLFCGWALIFLVCTGVYAQSTVRMDVAEASKYQANGVAIASDGRMFLSLPRALQQTSFSLGLAENGQVVPYPGGHWNSIDGDTSTRFSNVNAVRIEPKDPTSLWVVDCGSGKAADTKLVKIGLRSNQVERVYRLSSAQAPAGSCLNDVRVVEPHAFLTESGTGAIIIIDLTTGKVFRRLASSVKTKAERKTPMMVDGRPVVDPAGKLVVTHTDDIEVSPDAKWLYFSVPFGGTLWRAKVEDLLNTSLSENNLDARVENLGPIMPIGGFLMLSDGSMLLGDLVDHALALRKPDGKVQVLVQSPQLQWPDAMAVGPDGKVYEALPQANASPSNNHGHDDTKLPFTVMRYTFPERYAAALASQKS